MTNINLTIDDALIMEAQQINEHRSLAEMITVALQEYIDRHKQRQIVDLFGTIEYYDDYDYKEQRQKG